MRRWLIAGLLVWVPLGATLLVIHFLVGLADTSQLLLPSELRPDALFGFHVPGFGLIVIAVLVLGTGALAANVLGQRVLSAGERLLARVPLVRSVYGSMKKITEAVFSGGSMSFRRVVLIEYPRKGIWSIGFLAGDGMTEVSKAVGSDCVSVFVPTTPNPTSGFILQVPRAEVRMLPISIEDGMRYVISLGMAPPDAPRSPDSPGAST
ncbi:MAG: DUF502 domain-containing protein [Gammaproteobacteria bacterium]|nr:DUF502 domain-containing protein [Gammaproteobacteria bacterium]